MNINLNNYEAFFLDYHEGNLTPEQVADLLLFVEQHPQLKEEFENFEDITLYDLSPISFEHKSDLKKNITAENCEEYFIRSAEGDLTSTEKTLLADFIKQHPHYSSDLELFAKTIVKADSSIVFENKAALKREAVITSEDELLIASVEGMLTKTETTFLYKQLAVDAEMQHNYVLYQQTKLTADLSIVYEGKEELKRERKGIPFFYYVAAAASIALLIGLFFIYNGKTEESTFADKTSPLKTAPMENSTNSNEVIKNTPEIVKEMTTSNQTAVVVKNKIVSSPENKIENTPVIPNETPKELIAENKVENKMEETPKNEVIVKNEVPVEIKNEAPVFAKVESTQPSKMGQALTNNSEFLSLKEMMAEKLKSRTLDNETVAIQKRNGKLRRFSGWDVAQIVTKGISNVIGKDIEIKPRYNDEGNVTAYALGNGVEVSRGK